MAKNRLGWLVARAHDKEASTFVVLYDGPDRKMARAKAERALGNGAASVAVFKVSRRTSLTQNALVSSLPRESF